MDFDRYSTNQTFLGLKSVVLDNLTQDPSGVKESVTMRLFARLGVPAPRESFARLYVNNQLIGLYAIVEAIDKDLLARVFGTVDGNVQNDGYLFEYNYLLGSPWRFDYLGSALDPYQARFDAKTKEDKSAADEVGADRGAGPPRRTTRPRARSRRRSSRASTSPPSCATWRPRTSSPRTTGSWATTG